MLWLRLTSAFNFLDKVMMHSGSAALASQVDPANQNCLISSSLYFLCSQVGVATLTASLLNYTYSWLSLLGVRLYLPKCIGRQSKLESATVGIKRNGSTTSPPFLSCTISFFRYIISNTPLLTGNPSFSVS